jgi:N-acetylmuramoyl-L-alanine amidase
MAAAGLLGPAVALAQSPVRLERLSIDAQSHVTLLTLALSGPAAVHLFHLHAPERLVLDLPDTRRGVTVPSPPADSVVLRVRTGYPQPHQLRVVLELAHAVPVHAGHCVGSGACVLRIALGEGGELAVAGAPASAIAPSTVAPSAVAAPAPAPLRTHAAAHAPPSGERAVIVAVDAGHGGMDPGATGAGGTREKDVTLAIARALAARIDAAPGMRAVLTRAGDQFVPLRNRMERAAAAHADMFVSIHADAIRDREVSGASVYILSERGASSEAARMLADQENAADLKGGISLADQSPDLRPLLLSLSQSASISASGEAADRVLGALDGVGAVRRREVQQAAFVVLKSPDIPSLLVETAYISNPAEERLLRTPAQQQRLAGAVFSGIERYFQDNPPEGSQFAHRHERDARAEVARNAP